MNVERPPADYGDPALRIAGFQLWIHGRQFPDADGNWLRVTAHCGASGASVWAQGPIIMVTDIAGFGRQCEAMLRGELRSAVLDPLEPELRVSLEVADGLGHIRVHVEITPDHLTQSHTFEFELDQSCLGDVARECSAIVREFEVRGLMD